MTQQDIVNELNRMVVGYNINWQMIKYDADRAIMKINAQYRSKVLSIFDQIPGFLSQHEKRIVFKQLQEGSYAEQYEETFFWLADSMISNECFLCNDPNVGLSLNETRSYVKCYLGDTGLLVSHAFDENELLEDEVYKQILAGKLEINEGMLYENAIAQMLVANGHKLYFYTHYNEEKHRNDMEIDFIISNNSKLKYKMYPIEVKSGKHYKTTSPRVIATPPLAVCNDTGGYFYREGCRILQPSLHIG